MVLASSFLVLQKMPKVQLMANPAVDMLTGRLKKGDCVESTTDSSTSEGWLKISNVSELGENPIQAKMRIGVCRSDAKTKLEFGVNDHSQWFLGVHNKLADALSRDKNRSDIDSSTFSKYVAARRLQVTSNLSHSLQKLSHF